MPSASDRHRSRPLENISVAYIQSQSDFVARQVFPVVPVMHKADEYTSYNKDDWMRVVAQERAARTESAGGDFSLSRDTYSARTYALHYDIDDDERDNADPEQDPDAEATQYVTENLLRKQELDWATKYFGTGIWGTELTGVSGAPAGGQFQRWDEAGSTPIDDVDNAVVGVAQITGRKPNTIVTTPSVFVALKNHADILDRFKHTQAAVLTEQILARLFGVDRFLVAWGIHTTSEKDAAADTFDFVLGKHLLLAYVNPSPGLRQPSAGYTFAWRKQGANREGNRMFRFRIDEIKSDRVEGEMYWDQKVVGSDLGYFFLDAVN